MPKVLTSGKYIVFFWLNEEERMHVHVRSAEKNAKFWIEPIGVVENYGYLSHEISEIINILSQNKKLIISKWVERFGKS